MNRTANQAESGVNVIDPVTRAILPIEELFCISKSNS